MSAFAEAITGSFAISGPATTAGKGGVACGALDGSGLVGVRLWWCARPDGSIASCELSQYHLRP